MNNRELRRFAVFGLYLSGLAALVSAGLFIVYGSLTLPVQISLAIIVLGLALFVLLDPQRTREAFTGRQARYGSNAMLMTIAFVGIVIIANYLVSSNSRQWDLTEDQQNTLTNETIQTLASLSSTVKAEAYFTTRMPVENARTLLQNLQANSKGSFQYEIIDPETNPIRAQQARVTRDGTIVLRMEDRQEQVSYASEEELTSALIRLANPGERSVYFLTGHGEYGIDANSEANYNQISTALTAKNYTINTLNLLSNPNIPADALVLIAAGPTKPISAQEVDLIQAYLDNGGALIYLAEPRPVTEFGDAEDPLAAYLQSAWGILLDENIVIDLSSNRQLVAVSDRFGDHPITRKMVSMAVVLPSARSVRLGVSPPEVQLTELAYASDLAWGETDYLSIEQGQAAPNEGQDVFGPFSLAIAGDNNLTGARVLVIGDSDFAGSGSFNQYGNSDFLLNGIDWAAEQESLISLTARRPIDRFMLPPQTHTMGLILLGSVFALPGSVIFVGLYVWAQRRRQG
jgi:ABC-type uncharacterized transport system involved in gliding motility auxiliary subunit